MSEKRVVIGICGGLSPEGVQNNATVVSIFENEYGFYRTSPLDSVFSFAKAIGVLKEEMSEKEERVVVNKVCISGRTADGNMWINMALKNVPPDKKSILVDDIHFAEEAETIKRLGGVVLKINIPGGIVVNPAFNPDMVILGNTKEEVISSLKNALNNIRQSESLQNPS